ncbi:MAG: hypothetical protein H6686_06395 [Fibrobacteria bacterium]|nr:hypothetical protein [Fibrobacteria bacterium]
MNDRFLRSIASVRWIPLVFSIALLVLTSCGAAPPHADWKVDQGATRTWEGLDRAEGCPYDEVLPVTILPWGVDGIFDNLEDSQGQMLLDRHVEWWRTVTDSQYVLREIRREDACGSNPSRKWILQLVHEGVVVDSFPLGDLSESKRWRQADENETPRWAVENVDGLCLRDWAAPLVDRLREEIARHPEWGRSERTRYLLGLIPARRYLVQRQGFEHSVEIDLQARRFSTEDVDIVECAP